MRNNLYLFSCLIIFICSGIRLSAQDESSTYIYRNPPGYPSTWTFAGNQVVNVKYTNLTILGAIVIVDCESLIDRQDTILIAPCCTTQDYVYAKFDYCPINWTFNFSTFQDVTNVSAKATWESFVPDRPGY